MWLKSGPKKGKFPICVFGSYKRRMIDNFIFHEFQEQFEKIVLGITQATEFIKSRDTWEDKEGTEESSCWTNDLINKDRQQIISDIWNEIVESCELHRVKQRWVNSFRRVCELEAEKKYAYFCVNYLIPKKKIQKKDHYWVTHLVAVSKELKEERILYDKFRTDYFMVRDCHLDDVLRDITEKEFSQSSRMGKLLDMFKTFDPIKLPGSACAGESDL